jgi:hypothetical protein
MTKKVKAPSFILWKIIEWNLVKNDEIDRECCMHRGQAGCI